MTDPTPTQMLYEGAHDAIEAFSAIRNGLIDGTLPSLAIDLIDAHVDLLEYAIEAHEKEKGL